MKSPTDGGKSWGAPVYDVAIPDGLSRPGMAIIARDGKGKFYMSYELVSAPGYALEPRTNSTHFRTSMDGVNWGDAKSPGTLVQDRWRQFPNGTPYIVWSPWGGPDGTLLVTGRSVVRDEIGRVGQGMFVNQHGGEGMWSLVETPIDYDINIDGYSQTMLPLGDGREILQLVSVNSRIEYAKFKLPEKLPSLWLSVGRGAGERTALTSRGVACLSGFSRRPCCWPCCVRRRPGPKPRRPPADWWSMRPR